MSESIGDSSPPRTETATVHSPIFRYAAKVIVPAVLGLLGSGAMYMGCRERTEMEQPADSERAALMRKLDRAYDGIRERQDLHPGIELRELNADVRRYAVMRVYRQLIPAIREDNDGLLRNGPGNVIHNHQQRRHLRSLLTDEYVTELLKDAIEEAIEHFQRQGHPIPLVPDPGEDADPQ